MAMIDEFKELFGEWIASVTNAVDAIAAEARAHAAPDDGRELVRFVQFDAAGEGGLDDRLADRMLGMTLG